MLPGYAKPLMLGGLALTVLLGAGCGGVGLPPFTLTFNVDRLDVSSDGLEVLAGIPVNDVPFSFEVCDLPDPASFQDDIRDEVGGAADLINIDGIELAAAELVAVENDLDFVSELTLRYRPAPVDGVPQEEIVIGTVAAPEGGFGERIRLVPDESIDLLAILTEAAQNNGPLCPTLTIVVSGVFPEDDIRADFLLSGLFFVSLG